MAKRRLDEYFEWLEKLEEEAERELEECRASVDEARARARLSCACKDMRRGLSYPLTLRILEMANGRAERMPSGRADSRMPSGRAERMASAFGLADDHTRQ